MTRIPASTLETRKARSLDEALSILAAEPRMPIAGATDVYVGLNFGTLHEKSYLDIWACRELREIAVRNDVLMIGALATYADIIRSPEVTQRVPMLVNASRLVGGPQIQNRGTIGGNIANASPAGDTLPVLLATDAEIVLGSQAGERTVAARDFWPAYRQTARRDDELVLRVRIPLKPGRQVRFRKVGTRRAQAISKVVLAISWRPDGGVWRDVRVALGSVAATPIRAAETERVLDGAAPRRETADHAAATLADEIKPIDDVRSTADYRRIVAARVLHRLLREAGGW